MLAIEEFGGVPASAPGMILRHETAHGVVFSDAQGARWHGGPPLTADDAFQIASVTKPYTATIVLQLHEEGVVDLDERLPDGSTTTSLTACS